eukprot:scaffold32401_cov53-Phaeocystis_antarctica.AAC.3
MFRAGRRCTGAGKAPCPGRAPALNGVACRAVQPSECCGVRLRALVRLRGVSSSLGLPIGEENQHSKAPTGCISPPKATTARQQSACCGRPAGRSSRARVVSRSQ